MPERRLWGLLFSARVAGTNGSEPTGWVDQRQKEVLEQPTRRRILDVVRAQPGIKISNVCRESGASWGTVKYHLNVLQRAGLVLPRPTPRDCLLFPSDFPQDELAIAETLLQASAGRLARAILNAPGAFQQELCEELKMTRRVVRRNLGLLAAGGLVLERREAQYRRYYPDPKLVTHLGAANGTPPTGDLPLPEPPVEDELPPGPGRLS